MDAGITLRALYERQQAAAKACLLDGSGTSNKARSGRVKRVMNRLDKHDMPKRRVAARLRRMGLTVRT